MSLNSVRPTSLTVIASCGANGNTYPVGPTASPGNVLPGNATQVVWNPWQWEQQPGATPFAEATYVLKIWDERGPQATVRGGYLSPYAGTEFAMYRPAPYTPLASKFSEPFWLASAKRKRPVVLTVVRRLDVHDVLGRVRAVLGTGRIGHVHVVLPHADHRLESAQAVVA